MCDELYTKFYPYLFEKIKGNESLRQSRGPFFRSLKAIGRSKVVPPFFSCLEGSLLRYSDVSMLSVNLDWTYQLCF